MAFTYDEDLTTGRDKVRFDLGDTREGQGPRPDGRNFSDKEIAHLVSTETANLGAAVAKGFETLVSEWTSYALSEREGDVAMDAKEVAKEFSKRAAEWREKSGTGALRAPGYSEHAITYTLYAQ